jgi:hypothetical protein
LVVAYECVCTSSLELSECAGIGVCDCVAQSVGVGGLVRVNGRGFRRGVRGGHTSVVPSGEGVVGVGALRAMAAPFVAPGPSGVSIRTRLRLMGAVGS